TTVRYLRRVHFTGIVSTDTTNPRLSFFFFSCSGAHRHLHSFPTRRSSDLTPSTGPRGSRRRGCSPGGTPRRARSPRPRTRSPRRSEEHTSELQSLAYLVCRLLLEKKKELNIGPLEDSVKVHWTVEQVFAIG